MSSESRSLCSSSMISDFEVFYDRKLGRGAFGEVYVAKRKCSSQEVALKMINRGIIREGMEKRVWDEVRIHSQLKHPRIVELYECFKDEKYIYIVTELCECDLRQYLHSNGIMTETNAAIVLEQVVDGLLYLHKCKIIHRDLSAANIFLDKRMDVKIGDFGLATQVSTTDEKHFTMCGTPNFMAPEVAKRSSHGFEADAWSAGCLLYTMLTGRPPFGSGGHVNETLKRVVKNQVEIPSELSPEASDLILKLLQTDTKNRMRLPDVRNHPFLKKRKLSPHFSVTSSADSGRGTFASSLKTDSSRQSRNSERNLHRRFSPSPPMRVFRSESSARLPPSIPMYSAELKQSERPPTSRSCERSSTNVDRVCNHSKMNNDNCCAKCGQSSNSATLKPSSCNHSQRGSNFHCTKCGFVENIVSTSHRSAVTVGNNCDKCQSYQENGTCNGGCKLKQRSNRSEHCMDEPCCSKILSPSPTGEAVVKDSNGRTLNDVLLPLKSVRLKPARQETKNIVFTLMDDGDVCLELLTTNQKNISFVTEVTRISADGMKIVVYRPSGKKFEKLTNSPPTFDWKSAEHYTFYTLPTKYWKYYQVASNFINILRAQTWKIKLYTPLAKCCLMESGNFEVRFSNGKSAVKKKLSNEEWSSIECVEDVQLNCDEIFLVDSALKKCLLIERRLETLENEIDCCFPIIIFSRSGPSKMNINKEETKENSPISMSVPSRTTPRKPLTESTNVTKNVPQRLKTHYFKQYKCRMKELSDRDVEFAYEAGEVLLFLNSGNSIEYISCSGERERYSDAKALPSHVKHKVFEMYDMLRLMQNN